MRGEESHVIDRTTKLIECSILEKKIPDMTGREYDPDERGRQSALVYLRFLLTPQTRINPVSPEWQLQTNGILYQSAPDGCSMNPIG